MLIDMESHSHQEDGDENRMVNSQEGGYKEQLVIPSCELCDCALIGLDIGGSLAKVAYSLISHKQKNATRDDGGSATIHLASFDTEQFDECLDFIHSRVLAFSNGHHVFVGATGVGSYKYREQLLAHLPNTASLKVSVDSLELQRGLQGIHFLWEHLPRSGLLHPLSCQLTMNRLQFQCPLPKSGLLPCLIASLGSSLMIAKVNSSGQYEALVGASTQGGLSLLGLGSLLTSARTFDDLIHLAEKGNRMNVDLTVKDTAGGNYNMISASCLVSSFGLAAKKPNVQFAEADLAASLLYCVTDQMALTSYLTAQAHSLHNIVFYGSYLGGHEHIIGQIKEKMAACSYVLKHQVNPLFMQHEGHMGAIGALFEQHLQHSQSETHGNQ